jgi:hypothetical protein
MWYNIDSMEMIEAFTGEAAWCSESSAIFADCSDMVSSIGSVAFKHCLRIAWFLK